MKFIIAFSLFVLFLSNAFAGFYIDPHAGMRIAGKTKLAGRTFSHEQMEFGTKLGWHSGYTQFGLDANLVYPTYKAQDSSELEESYSGFQYGMFIGGRYTWIRGWVTWVIAATQTGDVNLEKYKGTGWELGASLGPQNMINFFIKLQLLQFRTRENEAGIETDLSDGQELETKAIIVGFNVPFNASGSKR